MTPLRRAAAAAALGGVLAVGRALAVGSALALAGAGAAQEAGASDAAPSSAEPAVEDEIIVLGRIGALRHELEIAEDVVFDRFNQIVGDERLEIHCDSEVKIDSHIRQRVCVSNSWRDENASIGQGVLGQVRSEADANPQAHRAEQLLMQQRLYDAVRRLAATDTQLQDAIMRVGNAQVALAEQTGNAAARSVSLEMQPGDSGVPIEAKRAYEVRVGNEPWFVPLAERTFTISSVTGDVRDLRVKCDRGSKRIDYRPDVDWTLPREWRGCSLRVDAKPGTTFALYEFE
jgi:hypothetical protein